MAEISNPVGCKLGPDADPDSVVALCDRLDPRRRPGHLVLIPRMGAGRVSDTLPALVRAIRRGGHRPVWLSDPMHGNTVRTPHGTKTRDLEQMVSEIDDFRGVLADEGVRPGGLHLEVAADEVTECVSPEVSERDLPRRNSTLCDPRLNPSQAAAVVRAGLTDAPGARR